MEVKQFEDKNLAHYSYALESEGEVALVDPARDPQPYYDFAKSRNAKITVIIETHPHADFVSSHLEIQKATGATIYVSKLLGAEYPHKGFDDGDTIRVGSTLLTSMNTPGHSPDSISIIASNSKGIQECVFTGDTLFIGDCGRPDLREQAGAITAAKTELAKDMYHSLRNKLMKLPNDTIVYPAHGAGSLCGKGLSTQNSSTIGSEKISNWSLKEMSEEAFIKELLADQPFIPKYFPYDVGINKAGATNYSESIAQIKIGNPIVSVSDIQKLDPNILTIDTRYQLDFKKSHIKNSVNLMNDNKFETWLGSIVNPKEPFYLLAENETVVKELIARCAKIGYESQIVMAYVIKNGNITSDIFDGNLLREREEDFTIVDIRNPSEVKSKTIIKSAIPIPLPELRERAQELPLDKPIVVHCAGGYRSAAGSSLLQSIFQKTKIYDLSDAVKSF